MRWANGFIAVDWGTTNRRAYRLDPEGECTGDFEDSKGVLQVPGGGFPAALQEIRERLGDLPLLLAGMVGSNKGWIEVPYVPCPAGIDELARKLKWASDREAIVPGVSFVGQGRADVMRGEEVQLLGGVQSGTLHHDGLVCHPGTHNKWALLRGGVIETFGTVMTGELFGLLKDHSILAELLQGPVEANDAFRKGARSALKREMLPAALFEVRAAVLLGQMKREDAPSYVSGLLIGTDVRIGLMWPLADRIGIMGRRDLTRLYAAAIEEAGRESIELDGEQSFLAGIRAIATRI
jgi:2-dehydro-3-deoxygalactonokinase